LIVPVGPAFLDHLVAGRHRQRVDHLERTLRVSVNRGRAPSKPTAGTVRC
jgi:hypothetical protein